MSRVEKIISLMVVNKGYEWAKEGICLGLAASHVEAYILGPEAEKIYEARLTRIEELFSTNNGSTPLTSTETEDILSYLDRVAIFQTPSTFLDRISHNLANENFKLLSLVDQSEELQAAGGLEEVRRFTHVYTVEELEKYLNSYATTLEKTDSALRVALLLEGENHALNLTYSTSEQQWMVSNNATFSYFAKSDHHSLTITLHQTLSAPTSVSTTSPVIFTTILCVTGNQLTAAKEFAATWQSHEELSPILTITPEKANPTLPVGNSWLITALCDDDEKTSLALIEANAALDTRMSSDKCRYNALHIAAMKGYTNIITILLAAKAEINAQGDIYRHTPLSLALLNNHCEVIELLIANKADVDSLSCDDLGHYTSPLYNAAYQGSLKVTLLLINASAQIDAADQYGVTPLAVAAKKGHTQIVNALLDAKANLQLGDIKEQTPLFKATANGHLDTVKALLQRSTAEVNKACAMRHSEVIGAFFKQKQIKRESTSHQALLGDLYLTQSLSMSTLFVTPLDAALIFCSEPIALKMAILLISQKATATFCTQQFAKLLIKNTTLELFYSILNDLIVSTGKAFNLTTLPNDKRNRKGTPPDFFKQLQTSKTLLQEKADEYNADTSNSSNSQLDKINAQTKEAISLVDSFERLIDLSNYY